LPMPLIAPSTRATFPLSSISTTLLVDWFLSVTHFRGQV
jgi:hypothetical protein